VDAPQRPLTWPPPGVLPPPRREPTFFERVPARPLGFAGLLFGLGWLGIIIQQGVLRQLIVGAPVFEEMAKFGLALAVVTALRIRPTLLRMPFAWASGAAFGVLEHFLTYSDEPPLFWGLRVAFHLSTAGLSMAIWGLAEPLPDARVRWATTLTSSAFHAANNLGALLLSLVDALPGASLVDVGYSALITTSVLVLTFAILLAPGPAHARAGRVAGRLFRASAPAAPAAPPDPPGP
jgi:hypothetical protein